MFKTRKIKYLILVLIPLFSCSSQVEESNIKDTISTIENSTIENNPDSLKIVAFYNKNSQVESQSKSKGSVSNGKLENGKIMPFYGKNFTYFDQDSYLASRAFTSDIVKKIVLDAYEELHLEYPERKFFLMELSNQEGGEIYPHRTHQNGLSVDFMMPKTQNGAPNYSLDTLGKEHYFLSFKDQGEYVEDPTIKVDFDLIAHHILILNEMAEKYDYFIEKVIIKIEYKDELFQTPHGQLLEKSGIYIVKNLSLLINSIHDDHFHIDFKKK